MSQRRLDTTKWAVYFLVLSSGPVWNPVSSVTVRTPERIPSTVEAQAKYFQDFFSVQLSPYKIEFGHVCEDPNTWEQRYEKKDFKNHRDMGKVRWGDKQGGYGEHYWDLNHAGHTGNDENDDYDDGSNQEDPQENHQEVGDQSNKYQYEEDNPDETSHYDESGRPKRANSKVKVQAQTGENNYEDDKSRQKRFPINTQEFKIKNDKNVQDNDNIDLKFKSNTHRRIDERYEKEIPVTREKKYDELVGQNVNGNFEATAKVTKRNNFVPYEGGAVVRQRPKVATPSVPRLFLEPSTGHVIDRATGQAYVLQPVPLVNRFS